MAGDPDIDVSAPWPHRVTAKNYPYSPSTASTASSSSSSVFSIDAPSSQSSVASSSRGWSSSAWINESESQHYYQPSILQGSVTSSNEKVVQPPPEVVALECRQHPRRTQRLNSSESQHAKTTKTCPRPPPSLVRQSERKDNFVDSLVGKLTCLAIQEGETTDEPITSRHHNTDDRDHMASFGSILRSRHYSWRQTAKSDRPEDLCTRGFEKVED